MLYRALLRECKLYANSTTAWPAATRPEPGEAARHHDFEISRNGDFEIWDGWIGDVSLTAH